MSLVAALCIGVCCALAVGFLREPRPVRPPRGPRPEVGARELWLHQAGVAVTPAQFVVGSVLAGAVACGLVVLLTGSPLVGIVPGAVVAVLPRAVLRTARATRGYARCWARGPTVCATSSHR